MAETTKTKPARAVRMKRKPVGPPAHGGGSPAAQARRTGNPCVRCSKHHVDEKGKATCNGHRRKVRPYQPCRKYPVPGAAVCEYHGGGSPEVAKRAAARVAWQQQEGEVAELLRECDLPEQHPIDGLLEVVRHAGAMMRLLGSMVAQLDLDPGEVRLSFDENNRAKRYVDTDDAIYGYNTMGDQAQHILVAMYGQWADRYNRACKVALDANIDERLVRNAEATSNAVFTAIERALAKANLAPEQAAAFSKTLADELRKSVTPVDRRLV